MQGDRIKNKSVKQVTGTFSPRLCLEKSIFSENYANMLLSGIKLNAIRQTFDFPTLIIYNSYNENVTTQWVTLF